MKNTLEHILDSTTFNEMIDRVVGLRAELRERLNGNVKQLTEIPTSVKTHYAIAFLAEILGLEIEWKNVNGYRQVKEILGE